MQASPSPSYAREVSNKAIFCPQRQTVYNTSSSQMLVFLPKDTCSHKNPPRGALPAAYSYLIGTAARLKSSSRSRQHILFEIQSFCLRQTWLHSAEHRRKKAARSDRFGTRRFLCRVICLQPLRLSARRSARADWPLRAEAWNDRTTWRKTSRR